MHTNPLTRAGDTVNSSQPNKNIGKATGCYSVWENLRTSDRDLGWEGSESSSYLKKKKKEQISASCHHRYGQKVTVHQAEQKAFWTCFTSSPTTNLLWKPPEQSGLFHSAQTKTTLPA